MKLKIVLVVLSLIQSIHLAAQNFERLTVSDFQAAAHRFRFSSHPVMEIGAALRMCTVFLSQSVCGQSGLVCLYGEEHTRCTADDFPRAD